MTPVVPLPGPKPAAWGGRAAIESNLEDHLEDFDLPNWDFCFLVYVYHVISYGIMNHDIT